MFNNSKKIILIMMILLIASSLVGCISEDESNNDDNNNVENELVWATNSGVSSDYFGIKYPSEWIIDFEDVDEVEVEFEVIADDSEEVGVDIELDLQKNMEDDYYKNISSEEEFYSYMENMIDTELNDVVVHEHKRTTVDGYPAYKVIYSENEVDEEGTEYEIKNSEITFYKDGFFGYLRYYAVKSKYDVNEAIANLIIDSIEFLK